MTEAQKRFVAALTVPLDLDIDLEQNQKAISKRKADAIDAVTRYCQINELSINKLVDKTVLPMPKELKASSKSDLSPIEQLRRSVDVRYAGKKEILRCFICIRKAVTLSPDDANLPSLCRHFNKYSDLVRHFRGDHLKRLDNNQKMQRPICLPIMILRHKTHLQRHANEVHGIRSAPKYWYL
ncbi:hypothetical protein F4782DRAFT_534528 [Xylaria castorea]|nr:hypothetical protein F4782DRAFT_534528 [Xylaria castorea]